MNPEDYVPYPLALALKKHGFDWECDHYYCAFDNEADVRFWSVHPAQSQNGLCTPKDAVAADAPTLAQAQKWLREEWGIHIDVYIYSDYPSDGKVCDRCFWGFELYAIGNAERIAIGDGMYDSYEQALSAGIAAALDFLGNEKE